MATANPAKKNRDKGDVRPPFDVPYVTHTTPGTTLRSRDGIVTVRTMKEPEGDVRLTIDGGTFKREPQARAVGLLIAQLLVGVDGNARTFSGRETDVLGLILAEWHRLDKAQLEFVVRQMVGNRPSQPIVLTDRMEEVEDAPNG